MSGYLCFCNKIWLCMHYKYIPYEVKNTCITYDYFPNNETDRYLKIGIGAPDRVNIPCLMIDTPFCHIDVKMTHNQN